MLDQIAKHVENDFTDETAAKVLSICRELLKSDHFGFDDNFFDVNGLAISCLRGRTEIGPWCERVGIMSRSGQAECCAMKD